MVAVIERQIPLINYVFSRRLLALALAVGAIQLLLAVSPLRAMPWVPLSEAFLIGALILHKRSTSMAWLNASTEPPLRVFLKSFFVYAVPAGILWGHFVVGVFLHYLPRTGLILSGPWASFSVTTGVAALCGVLLGDELSRLGRAPR